jgi:hypothetical protein
MDALASYHLLATLALDALARYGVPAMLALDALASYGLLPALAPEALTSHRIRLPAALTLDALAGYRLPTALALDVLAGCRLPPALARTDGTFTPRQSLHPAALLVKGNLLDPRRLTSRVESPLAPVRRGNPGFAVGQAQAVALRGHGDGAPHQPHIAHVFSSNRYGTACPPPCEVSAINGGDTIPHPRVPVDVRDVNVIDDVYAVIGITATPISPVVSVSVPWVVALIRR